MFHLEVDLRQKEQDWGERELLSLVVIIAIDIIVFLKGMLKNLFLFLFSSAFMFKLLVISYHERLYQMTSCFTQKKSCTLKLFPPSCMCFIHMFTFEWSFYQASQYFSLFAKGEYFHGVFGPSPTALLCVDWIFLIHPLLNETKHVCVSFFTVLIRIGDGVLFCFLPISKEKEFYLFILTRYREIQDTMPIMSHCTPKRGAGRNTTVL